MHASDLDHVNAGVLRWCHCSREAEPEACCYQGGIAAAYPVAMVLNERRAHAMHNAMHNKRLILSCFDVPDSSGQLKVYSLPQIDTQTSSRNIICKGGYTWQSS